MNDEQGPAAFDAAGPTGDQQPPAHGPYNSFKGLRTTTAVPWVIVGTLILVAAFHILAPLAPLDAGNPQTSEVVLGLAIYASLASWIVWACRRSNIGLRRLLGALPNGYNWLSWTRLAALLAVTMAFSYASWSVFAYLLSTVAPGLLEFLIEALWPETDPSTEYRLAMAVIAVIVAPVLEEGFFRGMLVNRWGSRWGLPTALVASSIAFGILHANPVGIGLVGLIAALLYLRTRTLIVPMAFHAANNLIAILGEYLSGDSGPPDIAAEVQELRDGILFGVVLVALTLPILIWYIRRHWPARDAPIPYMAADQSGIAEYP